MTPVGSMSRLTPHHADAASGMKPRLVAAASHQPLRGDGPSATVPVAQPQRSAAGPSPPSSTAMRNRQIDPGPAFDRARSPEIAAPRPPCRGGETPCRPPPDVMARDAARDTAQREAIVRDAAAARERDAAAWDVATRDAAVRDAAAREAAASRDRETQEDRELAAAHQAKRIELEQRKEAEERHAQRKAEREVQRKAEKEAEKQAERDARLAEREERHAARSARGSQYERKVADLSAELAESSQAKDELRCQLENVRQEFQEAQSLSSKYKREAHDLKKHLVEHDAECARLRKSGGQAAEDKKKAFEAEATVREAEIDA